MDSLNIISSDSVKDYIILHIISQKYNVSALNTIDTASAFQLELSNRFSPLFDALPSDVEEFSDAVNQNILETADKIIPQEKSAPPHWMQKDTIKAINNKKDVRKSYGDSSTHYKVAKAEVKKLV